VGRLKWACKQHAGADRWVSRQASRVVQACGEECQANKPA
jgi:hypothetical protein